ncbi:MAG: M24 family metallopeptidase [Candidatus Sumerlaeia bacterium]|nr:M24 family metallopeptidase [Candidatus Sumerlaeia bacterium]
MNQQAISEALAAHGLDAWLVYDFRGSNPLLAALLPCGTHLTRRVFLLLRPGRGPLVVASHIDAGQFASAGAELALYRGWEEMRALLARELAPLRRVAMEYSPGGALPVAGIVDAGTVELVRSYGVEVASSAELMQEVLAVWSDAALAAHLEDSAKVAAAKDSAFEMVRKALADGAPVTECKVRDHIRDCFSRDGLAWPDGPIVAVKEHSGDPHFEPTAERDRPIRKGDWLLIDLWARRPGNQHIFADITWVGACGEPSAEQLAVFDAVKAARDAALRDARAAWAAGRAPQGWELDEAARRELLAPGYGDFIRHRTGHSLSPGSKVHGLGANLDNLETRDTRRLLPRLGFTIEPGLYLPAFGVRLEINVWMDPASGPRVTSPVQDAPLRLA